MWQLAVVCLSFCLFVGEITQSNDKRQQTLPQKVYFLFCRFLELKTSSWIPPAEGVSAPHSCGCLLWSWNPLPVPWQIEGRGSPVIYFRNTVRKLMLCELSAPHWPLARVSGCCRTDLSSALKRQAGGFCSRCVSTRRVESSCEGSCAEPNSKQFVLLSTLASVLEEALKSGPSTEKRALFSPPKKCCRSAEPRSASTSWGVETQRVHIRCWRVDLCNLKTATSRQ